MAEKLAELRQKGGKSIESNLSCVVVGYQGTTSWGKVPLTTTVNDPAGASVGVLLDPDFGHLDDGSIVVDKAIPTAYLSVQVFSVRNTSGTRVFTGLRVLKNGSVISGSEQYGTTSTPNPYERRIPISLAVNDIITIQTKISGTGGAGSVGNVNIVTDD